MNKLAIPLAAALLAAFAPGQRILSNRGGGSTGEFFGDAVEQMDDIDGDGFREYLAGAPRFTNSVKQVGRVDAISGRTNQVLYSVFGTTRFGRFGERLLVIPDVNRDGVRDFVVGAPDDGRVGTNAGHAACYSGVNGGLIWSYPGFTHIRVGTSFATLPDRDGDGVNDIAIGGEGTPGSARGWVDIVSARTGTRLARIIGLSTITRFGTSLTFVGDTNGDGWDELAVGAPGGGAGSVRYFSFGTGQVPAFFRATQRPGGIEIGTSMALVGDITGDGISELIVGGRSSPTEPGFAELLDLAGSRSLRSYRGQQAGDFYGNAVSGGFDVDNDGVPDFAVTAPFDSRRGFHAGTVFVYSGATLQVIMELGGRTDSAFGWDCDIVPDVDGDGIGELLVGAPRHDFGRTDSGLYQVHGFDVPSQAARIGLACAGTTGLPDINANLAHTRLGGTLDLTTANLLNGTVGAWFVGAGGPALSLAGIGMPGCHLYVTPTLSLPFVATGTSANLRLPVPRIPSLLQAFFGFQNFSVDPGANAFGMVASQFLRVRLGNR